MTEGQLLLLLATAKMVAREGYASGLHRDAAEVEHYINRVEQERVAATLNPFWASTQDQEHAP